MTKNSFRIVVDENPMKSRVFLNDVELTGVVRVAFDLDANRPKISRLRLEIIGSAEVDGEFVEQSIVNVGAK